MSWGSSTEDDFDDDARTRVDDRDLFIVLSVFAVIGTALFVGAFIRAGDRG